MPARHGSGQPCLRIVESNGAIVPSEAMPVFPIPRSWSRRTLVLALVIALVSVIACSGILPIAMAMLLYASRVSSDIKPLVPALQNNVLMVHITVGVMAYSCFTVAFGAGVLYLVQERIRRPSLPALETLDEIGFSAVAFGFPFMVLLLILGAYWANAAWGRYWGWDPKETAALVTLLIYAAYLHTRALRNWRGRRGAVLLVIGFVSVMITYFGNYFLTGLHAYR